MYSNPDYINDNGINLSTSDINQASSLLNSYMQILKSKSFLNSVIDEAGLDREYYTPAVLSEEISASSVSGTAVFKVVVYDYNPYNAMNIANTIGKLAPDKIVSIVKSGGIEVLDEATLPTAPYQSTSVMLLMLIGVVGGCFISACWFLIKGLTDTRIRRVYEVEDKFTIPILGKVPEMIDNSKNDVKQALLTKESPFVLREPYNDIRTNLLFLGKGKKCPVFVITSADYDEGKTTSSINVSELFALMGKKALLIDADLRNGDISEILQLSKSEGLSEYLADISELKIHKSVESGFDVITSGIYPPNPTDLLINDKWIRMIEDLKEKYDVIVIDTPSLGVVSDGLELVNVATAYIVIIREYVSKMEREEMIIRKLEAVDANICGFIYNGISMKSEDYNHKDYINGGDYGKRSSSRVQY